MNANRSKNRFSHRRRQTVDAQFPAGDVACSFDSWIGYSGYEHCTKKKTIGSKRDRG
jgi:hypothetical protein